MTGPVPPAELAVMAALAAGKTAVSPGLQSDEMQLLKTQIGHPVGMTTTK